MTKEKETIERLNKLKNRKILYGNRAGIIIEEFKTLQEDIETALNMIKEKDRKLEKKDKQIYLMAEEINETDRGYIDYCQFKMVCDRNCKECIKQYFESKVEEC